MTHTSIILAYRVKVNTMDEKNRKKIGDRIRRVRKALGLKQSDIARELKIGRTHMTNIEKGDTIPAYLLHWLNITHRVSLDWIFSGTGEMFVNDAQYDPDIKQMFEDFSKCPQLKHRVLSDYFTIRDRYINPWKPGGKGKKKTSKQDDHESTNQPDTGMHGVGGNQGMKGK